MDENNLVNSSSDSSVMENTFMIKSHARIRAMENSFMFVIKNRQPQLSGLLEKEIAERFPGDVIDESSNRSGISRPCYRAICVP
jgi:hypothetical protein